MKAIAIGIGVLSGLGALWFAFSGGDTAGRTSPAFDYESATLDDRQRWLDAQAGPVAKMFDRSLPKGNDGQPHMSVQALAANARRRAITMQVRVQGTFDIDKRAVPAAKKAMVAQNCPSYAKSALGANKVTLFHTFLGKDGREALSFAISPVTCRDYM